MLTLPPRSQAVLTLAFTVLAAGACQSGCSSRSSTADVWAVVDGREIREADVEKEFRRTSSGPAITGDAAVATKLAVLDQLITQNILIARATELKITLPDSELDTAFTNAKNGISDEAFNRQLGARNLTAADVRDALRRDLLAQKVVQQDLLSGVAISDKEINDFFQANTEQFKLPEESFHLIQIVVTPVAEPSLSNRTGDDATSPAAAAAKTQMITERLKAGTPFAQLAMDYSEEPDSAPKGGDVGLVPISALQQAPAKLRDAVLKSEPGTVAVVDIEGGYTIVGLVARLPAGQRDPSMPDVRDSIKSTLQQQREELLRTAYIETMRDRATVVNYAAQRIVDSAKATVTPTAPVAAKPQ
jgi:peptidyl-prolyl cis-trans isomerase SurA